jgi:hypothetical protein
MANYVYHRITITGEVADVEKFRQKANFCVEGMTDEGELTFDKDEVFSFWNFITPPEEDWKYYFGKEKWEVPKPVGHEDWNEMERLAFDLTFQGKDRTDTNYRLWNTRGDAFYTEIEDFENGHIAVSFQTAWSPASPVFEAMVAQHPELDFEIWWEEEQGFGEELESVEETNEAGEVVKVLTKTKSWDIPNSHKDYTERDLDDCVCHRWYDSPEDWFDDCPDKEKALQAESEEPNLLY